MNLKQISQPGSKTPDHHSLRNLLLATPLLAVLVGCASGTRFSEYRPTLPPPAEGYGRVWFYRPSAVGPAVQPAVKLDDHAVGRAVPHGFFHVETLPGVHNISATTEWKHKTAVTVSTNADTYVRLDLAMGLFVGHIIPKEALESKATNDLKNLRLITTAAKQ